MRFPAAAVLFARSVRHKQNSLMFPLFASGNGDVSCPPSPSSLAHQHPNPTFLGTFELERPSLRGDARVLSGQPTTAMTVTATVDNGMLDTNEITHRYIAPSSSSKVRIIPTAYFSLRSRF